MITIRFGPNQRAHLVGEGALGVSTGKPSVYSPHSAYGVFGLDVMLFQTMVLPFHNRAMGRFLMLGCIIYANVPIIPTCLEFPTFWKY